MTDADIIVVGAGPVGMLAALLSARQGLGVLLLEQSAARHTQSRANGITPPSLEILNRLGLAELFIDEVIHADLRRMPRGVPLTASILEVAEEFLLLGIDRNDRLAAALKVLHPGVEMLELRVAVWVMAPLAGLAGSL